MLNPQENCQSLIEDPLVLFILSAAFRFQIALSGRDGTREQLR
jgi:hypothetical protein